MSDIMTPIPFSQLMGWIMEEQKQGSIFGVRKLYKAKKDKNLLEIFGEKMETPFGPAAGPHTQLAQNIVAAYVGGSRFFELKTIQTLDGEDLPVSKPCIIAEDEAYNVEWSTELRVERAMEEYIKAWFAMKLISKQFGFGASDGFIFNMSVGYDYEGITSKKIDDFINGLNDARGTKIWQECKEYALNNLSLFPGVTAEDIEAFSPHVCTSITLSTLHGCPPKEIERIATHLIEVKKLNTFIKCNPTLLGYEFARKTMDDMGYDYLTFDDHHFKNDLQYSDAVPMLTRLQEKADNIGVEFGVKLTNTFPVKIVAGELPGEEMYMSGRSLFPLSISLASKLSETFDGKLRMSFSGGADVHNIDRIFSVGIWPITIATTLLKAGGYDRISQIAEKLEQCSYGKFSGIDVKALKQLAKDVLSDPNHLKAIKPAESKKIGKQVPLVGCFTAPCSDGCPIGQDIPEYLMSFAKEGPLESLKIITDKNPLPFMTGTICSHRCQSKCMRGWYEDSVHIRGVKLEAAKGGYDELVAGIVPPTVDYDKKVAVIGAGPAGLSAAYFLAKSGYNVTVFEKQQNAGGIVKYIIPEFRISSETIEKDIKLVESMGVTFVFGKSAPSLDTLKEQGFENIVVAVGAWKNGSLKLDGVAPMPVLDFLWKFKNEPQSLSLGKNVVVIGGGNTAMDAARAAKRSDGVDNVYLVYRRTSRYMPADEEELLEALEDGVEFKELLAPLSYDGSVLRCSKMILGEPDESGRRSPVATDEIVEVPANTVITAVGEQVDGELLGEYNVSLSNRGKAQVSEDSCKSDSGVYVIGDARRGPATIVEAIADAISAAESIVGSAVTSDLKKLGNAEVLATRKGEIKACSQAESDCSRCLGCSTICEVCADVCPNRANVAISVDGLSTAQIIHVDMMCNECGNCEVFCPYDSRPYKDKFTLFHTISDFEDSTNSGFLKSGDEYTVRIDGNVSKGSMDSMNIPQDIKKIIAAVQEKYSYI